VWECSACRELFSVLSLPVFTSGFKDINRGSDGSSIFMPLFPPSAVRKLPRGIGLQVIRVYCLYTHLSAILNEATVFCVTGGHRG
jgi:hypothetical protein